MGDGANFLLQTWRRVQLPSFLLVLISLLATTPVPVRAQERVSFSISPLVFELTMNPGDTREDFVTVTNASETDTYSFTMSLEPFVGSETGAATIVDQGDPAYSLKEWVTITPSKLTLKPQQRQRVAYKIQIPKNAEPGGRYGSIVAATEKPELGQTGAVTVQKVGSLVLLSVRGEVTYRAFPSRFETVKAAQELENKTRKTLYEQAPVHFLTEIHNAGTVHIKPKGFVTVSNMFGKKIADLPFPERNILPNSDRIIELDWKDAPIGRYTATLVLNYGDKGEQLTATTSFTVFPWKVGLPIIAASLAIVWFVIARRKRIFEALSIIFGKR